MLPLLGTLTQRICKALLDNAAALVRTYDDWKPLGIVTLTCALTGCVASLRQHTRALRQPAHMFWDQHNVFLQGERLQNGLDSSTCFL